MGYILTGNTGNVSISARLTSYGRSALLSSPTSLITKFSLSDQDSNYNQILPLLPAQVPGVGGDLTSTSAQTNSIGANITLRSKLFVDNLGNTYKNVESASNNVISSINQLGVLTLSATSLTQNLVNRTNLTTDPLVNLFKSFNLPISTNNKIKFTNTTSTNGGYSDTALANLNADNILVVAIPNDQYGETLEGKSININITTSGSGTYNIYSTYLKSNTNNIIQDSNTRETSILANNFGDNVVFLFSDQIKKPNNDVTKSWATGYNQNKPYANYQKQLFNYTSDNNGNVVDKVVGIAFLDMGFIVITDPFITGSFDTPSATTVTFNSLVTDVSQVINCVVSRGEFSVSSNSTFSPGDIPRVSEVGLYDDLNNIVAIAKFDRHILVPPSAYMVLNVKISV